MQTRRIACGCRKAAHSSHLTRRRKFSRALTAFVVGLVFDFASTVFAHNLDTSYARVGIGLHEVEFKFTYDLLTLERITKLDANGNGEISRGELQASAAIIQKFLRNHIYLELNQREDRKSVV